MAASGIRRFGDACLRRRAVEAAVDAAETKVLLDTMWEILEADGGVGLAAPQIDVNQRAVVIRNPDAPESEQRIDLVNPVIRRTYGKQEPFEEGCLSFPGLYTNIMRPQGVELTYESPNQGQRQLRTSTVLARIIQHEVDHLDGVLFIDHLSPVERWLLGPKLLWITVGRIFGR